MQTLRAECVIADGSILNEAVGNASDLRRHRCVCVLVMLPGPFSERYAGVRPSMLLLDVLRRCRVLSEASEDAVFASAGVAEIVAILDRAIAAIESGGRPDRSELTLLFAPTGDLQETSMANGWAEEYLTLSARFDHLIAQV